MIQRLGMILFCVCLTFDTGCGRQESVTIAPAQIEHAAENYQLTDEPDYAGSGLYCKIAVGPNADEEFWAVADLEGEYFYFDANQNGDLTDASDRFDLLESTKILETRYWQAVVPSVAQGEDIHTDLKVKLGKTNDDVKAVVSVKLWGWDESTTDADLIPLRLANNPQDAPTIHFNGPLVMGAYRERTELPIGKSVDFYSLIGTPGQNGGTLTAITNSEIPDDAHPQAVFEFPNRDSTKPPLRLTTFLTVRC